MVYLFAGITLKGVLVLKSTMFFKKAPYIDEKGPFCNVKAVVLLSYIHSKRLWSYRDGQLT